METGVRTLNGLKSREFTNGHGYSAEPVMLIGQVLI